MQTPSLSELFITFFKIGAFTFGGGYAMLPIIHEEIVLKKKWLSEESFCNVLGVTQSAPGALAINSSIFLGYQLAGLPGAFIATLGVALPSFLIILAIAIFFHRFSRNKIVEQIFAGVRPAVVALIAYAGIKLAKTALQDRFAYFMTVVVITSQLVFKLNPFLTILLSGVLGAVYYRYHATRR